MNSFKQGWFTEMCPMSPGQALSLEIDHVLHEEKSKYQHIVVFQSKTFGRVLVLDGVIQCTERDEFSYQEMISFLPLNSHPEPKKVLIIGGGDGGVLREVVKHPSVETVVQCEIDERVIEVSKKYLPFLSTGYSHPKASVHVDDGFAFVSKYENEFDVIITDSSDPVGPAESLFQQSFYELLHKALKPGGIVCCQGESMWFNLDLVQKMLAYCSSIFPTTSYAYTSIPTYPGGHIGFILCSKNPNMTFEAQRIFSEEETIALNLRYYNVHTHRAAFALPQFVRQSIDGSKKANGDTAQNGHP